MSKNFRAWVPEAKSFIYSDDITAFLDEKTILVFGCGQWKKQAVAKVECSTCLKDKNGRVIYEGDILECHHKTLGKVFFHDGSYRLSSDQCELNLDDILSYDNLDHYLIEDNDLVVIGNIYENPELLDA